MPSDIVTNTIKLADPIFYNSGPIDMLIGADAFYEHLCVGKIRQPPTNTTKKLN